MTFIRSAFQNIEKLPDKFVLKKTPTELEVLKPESPQESPQGSHGAKNWIHCKSCPRKFTSIKRLENHVVRYHDSRKPFKCKLCRASFKHRSKLWNHTWRIHGYRTEDIREEAELEERTSKKETKQKSIFHNIELLAISDAI